MRIIAGTARSLPLKTVAGNDTRPTTDRIKETLFNMLQADVPGSRFLDLFAGSGQIGLEALSRGAAYAVFVENSRRAAACIEENIAFTKFGQVSRLLVCDVLSGLRALEKTEAFDLIFMDPPYGKGCEKQVLGFLAESSLAGPDTKIIVEASKDTSFDYLDALGLVQTRCRSYKTNRHVFIERRE